MAGRQRVLALGQLGSAWEGKGSGVGGWNALGRSKWGGGAWQEGGRRRKERRRVSGVRWRARRAALMAVQGAASGLVASVVRGNGGWPRSTARQGRVAHLGATAVSRCVAERVSRRARRRQGAVGLTGRGRGRSAGERAHSSGEGGSAAQRARQRRSECTRGACLSVCARREGRESEGEREGREKREWREKERVNPLTCSKLKIFHGNSKNFEHKSCSKFKFLQLSFQAKLRLSNDLKV
jgi:hypothetical protein